MIGIDLGTTNVRIHVKGRGVVLREPAVIAIQKGTTDVKAVGEEAYRMLGRTPGSITAVRPMADGLRRAFTFTPCQGKSFTTRAANLSCAGSMALFSLPIPHRSVCAQMRRA